MAPCAFRVLLSLGPWRMQALSQTSNQMNAQYPSVLTYQGGKTNRYDGAYAGITDWRGGGGGGGGGAAAGA
jgi:hypothetical protein